MADKKASIKTALESLEKKQSVINQSLKRLERWQKLKDQPLVLVESAVELTQEEIDAIQTELSFKFKRQFEVVNQVNPEVLGGLRIQVGNLVVDTTLQTKLNMIRKELM